MQKITPFLWFDNNGEEALKYYAEVFGKNAKLGHIARYGPGAPVPAGTMMTGSIEIFGQQINILNGGPHYQLTPAFSFSIDCETQEEVDYYWDKLTAGGQEMPCGWLTDKYGLSWQVVPSIIPRRMSNGEPAKAGKMMQALMTMKKLDIAALDAAYNS
ncbi:VOC family protein [Chitinophaga lutea]